MELKPEKISEIIRSQIKNYEKAIIQTNLRMNEIRESVAFDA